jgi:alpha-mannosidase
VAIVPHTHWDREWHVPFQAGRVRLVRLLDLLLDTLETSGLDHFWLDGQTAVIDDYLAVRPDAEPRVRAAVSAGRLGIGPWAVQMDEFVVSPETIVRNLEAGLRRRAELGGRGPAVGYGPDVFGHVAQLPQILRQAGIDHAVVWRGVPAAVEATAFRWEAPDGSSVRAEYLSGSYANGKNLPADGPGLVDRARSWEAEVGNLRVGGLLLMNGGDQQPAETAVTRAVAEANRDQRRYRFEIADLARWLDDQRADTPDRALCVWRGELRSSARAPLLSGVISNRVDVRAAAAAAERAVERRAEPLLALFRPAEEWAAAAPLLAVAWNRLIANSAHDSACACCTDPVSDQVLVRYSEARQIGDALADQVLADLASETGTAAGEVLVVNTQPQTRSGIVEITAPAGRIPDECFVGADGIPRAVQLLGIVSEEVFAARVAGEKVGWVADRIDGPSFDGRPVRHWSLDDEPADAGGDREPCLRFEAAGPDDAPVGLDDARRALLELGRAGPPVTIRMDGPVQRRVLVETGPVPGYGWTTLRRPPVSAYDGGEPSGIPVRVSAEPGGPVLDNGIVRVEVDAAAGTFAATRAGRRVAGLNRYVDGGDGGDTYTWCPPAVDTVVERPESVTVDIAEAGPLRGRVMISATYRWPACAEGDERRCSARSERSTATTITTTVSVVAGDPVVAVEVSFDNRCRDHRLRVHFPLPEPVTGSDAGCAFAVVHRGLDTEFGPPESPPPTFPARRFVDCSAASGPGDGGCPPDSGGGSGQGFAVIADGTFEYEVCEDGRELAVTLLRATGWLSRRRLPRRPDPAGPAVPVDGAQVQGLRRFRYGLLLHAGDWETAHLSPRADSFLHPLEVTGSSSPGGSPPGAPTRPAHGQALRVEAGGAAVSSVIRDGDGVVVRLFHPGSQLVSATLGAAGFSDTRVDLRPGEIATVRLGRSPGAG